MPRKMAREPGSTIAAADIPSAIPPTLTPIRQKKIDQVIALLCRSDGATLAEMIEVTGWLPHTTRAVLSRLRKKGHTLDKSKRNDGATLHRIVDAA